MTRMRQRPDWEDLANKYGECRVFIEFAYSRRTTFAKWLEREVEKR